MPVVRLYGYASVTPPFLLSNLMYTSIHPRDNAAVAALVAYGEQGTDSPIPDLWLYSPVELGAITAIRRFGHYEAAKLMCLAKIPIFSALRLINIAYNKKPYKQRLKISDHIKRLIV